MCFKSNGKVLTSEEGIVSITSQLLYIYIYTHTIRRGFLFKTIKMVLKSGASIDPGLRFQVKFYRITKMLASSITNYNGEVLVKKILKDLPKLTYLMNFESLLGLKY